MIVIQLYFLSHIVLILHTYENDYVMAFRIGVYSKVGGCLAIDWHITGYM